MSKTQKRILTLLLAAIVAIAVVCAIVVPNELALQNNQQVALNSLKQQEGNYDAQKLVLNKTSKEKAQLLANKLSAKLRITSDGTFATLTLPEGVKVEDVYFNKEYRKYLPELSLDVYSRTSDINANERIPSAPQYSVTDTRYSEQTYLNYLNMSTVWNSYKGNNVTVAVIDTGIDTDHPEFANKISINSYNATQDKVVKDYNNDWSLIEDEQGHGTSVAGVIASAMDGQGIVGIAPNVNLLVIKAECTPSGAFINTSDLVFGLYYAIEQDVDVVNMSFGGYGQNPYAAPLRLAVDSDIICVAAAGNDGTTQLCYPAADENTISVGALAEDSWQFASYSNYGENVNIVAPGTTFTAKMDGTYGIATGTSLASPVVAGAMALLKQQNKRIEYADVQELLYASAYDLGGLGQDFTYGYGALDVSALLIEQRGKVTFDMLTDELEDIDQLFIRNHTLQNLPEPERLYAIFDGWYYDIQCTEELNWYEDVFTSDLTLYANWVNEDDGVPYTYVTLADNTIEIRSYTGRRRYITVPEIIDGKQVTSIGDFAFSNQTRLREVTLPNTINNIGRSAFENCVNLTNITIPQEVTSIGVKAFSNNIRLHSVAFSPNARLQSVGNGAFAYSGLTRIELPKSVNSVNGSAFLGATNLQAINVDKANASFMSVNGVLFNKSGSSLVAFPAGITKTYTVPVNTRSVEDYAFGYSKLTSINLSYVQRIGDSAFVYSSLNEVSLPDTLTYLGESAFSNNFNLSRVTLSSALENILNKAFAGCNMLAEVTIPSGVISIGSSAFAQNVSLQSVTFAENSRLNQIGAQAFLKCSSLQSITIPNSTIAIGQQAFSYCSALQTVTINNNSNLQAIGAEAFGNCVSLTKINLPQGLLQIGGYAFMNTALATVNVPASVNSIGSGAFASCHVLTAINVDVSNAVYVSSDGVVYNRDKTVLVAYPSGKAATSYSVLSSVEKIGDAAFYGSYNLASVTLPSALKTVGKYAFYDCKNITGYSLPASLQSIEEYAFALNAKIRTLAIPDNVTQLSRYAFAYDYALYSVSFTADSKLPRIGFGAFAHTGLTSFRVPASVSSIAQYAFDGCSNLTTVTFAQNSQLPAVSAYMFDGCSNLTTVTFEQGSALTNIQAHAFEGLTKLQTVNFGNAQITNIDNYAFRFCQSLTTLTIPSGVTDIGRYAFYGATNLTRLDLPESIEFIGRYAFYGASNLDVYFESLMLPMGLQENWDNGIKGYYVGVANVLTKGDWTYAELKNGNVSLVKYNGTATELDLNTLDLGADVETIGGYCFNNSNVTSVVLPQSLTHIQAYAFANSKITQITIPQNVRFIGQYAFFHTPLESVSFASDSKLAKIEQYAFAETRALQQISLPASLEQMGSYAFYQSGVKQVIFAENIVLQTIPEHAFASSKLQTVTLPYSVTLIDDNAFRDCLGLQNVSLPEQNDLSINSNAFYNTSLASVNIPANVIYVGEYAFVGLTNLNAFTVSADNPYYSSVDGLLYNKDGSKLISVPAGRTGSLQLPQTIQTIGFGAFENTKLSAVSFDPSANILTFGYRAFYAAENLTEITIPASVVSVDYYAFAMCKNLSKVTFAEGTQLKGVYEGAFYGCINLTDITLPDSIVEISDFAFYGCSNLTELPVSETNQLKGIYSYAFAYTGISELTLPETVTELGEYAFRGAKITSVVIPDTNAKELLIHLGAFADCNALTEITVPFIGASYDDEQITWFGYIFGAGAYTANNDYVPASLKTITVTEGITCLRTHSLYNLMNVEQINLPYSITTLEQYVFGETEARYEFKNEIIIDVETFGNYNYKYFGKGLSGRLILGGGKYLAGTSSSWTTGLSGLDYLESVELTNSFICIGRDAFNGLKSLRNVIIPETVSEIGLAFGGCNNLEKIIVSENNDYYTSQNGILYDKVKTKLIYIPKAIAGSITIPNSITSINSNENTFRNRSSLTNIIIPSSVISIDYYAFSGCSSLESITIPFVGTKKDGMGNTSFGSIFSSVPSSVKTVIITGGVVNDRAFLDCMGL